MVGVWAELMDDDEIVAALPALARGKHHLATALPATRIRDVRFAELTRRARDAGVSVRVWPLLAREDGYWINEGNVDLLANAVDSLLDWQSDPRGPAFDGISFDLEPAFDYAELLRSLGRERPLALVETLRTHVDRPRFRRARDTLARTVDQVKRNRLFSHAVAIPMLLDQAETDDVLEDALDTPLSGIDWDEVSFMAYQTPFAELVGSWLGPGLVFSYATSAVRRFGARAGIDLGIVGDAGLGVDAGNRYPGPESLAADYRAALEAGIDASNIRVYGLKGLLDSGGLEPWLAFPERGGNVISKPSSALVEGLRNGTRALVTALRVTTPR